MRLALSISIFVAAFTFSVDAQQPAAADKPAIVEKPAPVSLRKLSLSLERLTGRVRPAVVQVFTTGYAPLGEEVMRDGKRMSLTVPVVEREDDPMRFIDLADPAKNIVPKLGILAIPISPEMA